MMSNELDILVVGYNDERFSVEIRRAFRHWQVYAMAAPHAIYGRRFRRAYITRDAINHDNFPKILAHLESQVGSDNVIPFDRFRPEYDVQTLEEADLLRQLRRSRHPAA